MPIDVWLDVAVFGAASADLGDSDLPTPLVIETRRFDTASSKLEFVVDQKPVRVGIDPYDKIVDRNPDDNLRRVGE